MSELWSMDQSNHRGIWYPFYLTHYYPFHPDRCVGEIPLKSLPPMGDGGGSLPPFLSIRLDRDKLKNVIRNVIRICPIQSIPVPSSPSVVGRKRRNCWVFWELEWSSLPSHGRGHWFNPSRTHHLLLLIQRPTAVVSDLAGLRLVISFTDNILVGN